MPHIHHLRAFCVLGLLVWTKAHLGCSCIFWEMRACWRIMAMGFFLLSWSHSFQPILPNHWHRWLRWVQPDNLHKQLWIISGTWAFFCTIGAYWKFLGVSDLRGLTPLTKQMILPQVWCGFCHSIQTNTPWKFDSQQKPPCTFTKGPKKARFALSSQSHQLSRWGEGLKCRGCWSTRVQFRVLMLLCHYVC